MPFGDGNGKLCKVQRCKTTGMPCKKLAVNGYDVCGTHGGLTPRGTASVHYQGKGHSRNLPTRLADKYQEAISNPELLSLRSDIALLDVRIAETIENIDTGPIGRLWGAVRKAYLAQQSAMQAKDAIETIKATQELDALTKRGFMDYINWDEIRGLLQERARLVAMENKIMNDADLTVAAEKVILLVAAIASVVMDNVADNKTRAKITRGIDVLISSGV
jgi:hypothetical protein